MYFDQIKYLRLAERERPSEDRGSMAAGVLCAQHEAGEMIWPQRLEPAGATADCGAEEGLLAGVLEPGQHEPLLQRCRVTLLPEEIRDEHPQMRCQRRIFPQLHQLAVVSRGLKTA
jgi:hypothetical protein